MTAMLLTIGMFSACSSDEDEGIVVNATSDSPKDENYLIRLSYTAWLFENVYNSKGEKIDLSQSQEEVDNLLAYSSEWFIIYEV